MATWPKPGWSKRLTERARLLRQPGFPCDPWLFIRVLSFALATRLLVRLNPELLRRLLAGESRTMVDDTGVIKRIVDHVDLAIRLGRPLVPTGCMTRGLTLYHFLAASGVNLRLRFGLGLLDGRFDGHCWLEMNGAPILEDADPRRRFKVMFSIP